MRKILVAFVTFLFSTTTGLAGQLIFSLDYAASGSAAPLAAPEGLQFVIQFHSFNDPGATKEFGQYEHVFWQDGTSGSHDFTPTHTEDFGDFSFIITNGIDDELGLLTLNSAGSGGGGLSPESVWGFGHPDLFGNEIDLISLVVHDLSIQPYWSLQAGEGLQWNGHITWEFWGTPTPEPVAIFLLAFGLAVVRPRSVQR